MSAVSWELVCALMSAPVSRRVLTSVTFQRRTAYQSLLATFSAVEGLRVAGGVGGFSGDSRVLV